MPCCEGRCHQKSPRNSPTPCPDASATDPRQVHSTITGPIKQETLSRWPHVLDFIGTPLVIEPSPGQRSSDAGLLPIRQFDERIGLTQAFTAALDDPRDPDLIEHSSARLIFSDCFF